MQPWQQLSQQCLGDGNIFQGTNNLSFELCQVQPVFRFQCPKYTK